MKSVRPGWASYDIFSQRGKRPAIGNLLTLGLPGFDVVEQYIRGQQRFGGRGS